MVTFVLGFIFNGTLMLSAYLCHGDFVLGFIFNGTLLLLRYLCHGEPSSSGSSSMVPSCFCGTFAMVTFVLGFIFNGFGRPHYTSRHERTGPATSTPDVLIHRSPPTEIASDHSRGSGPHRQKLPCPPGRELRSALRAGGRHSVSPIHDPTPRARHHQRRFRLDHPLKLPGSGDFTPFHPCLTPGLQRGEGREPLFFRTRNSSVPACHDRSGSRSVDTSGRPQRRPRPRPRPTTTRQSVEQARNAFNSVLQTDAGGATLRPVAHLVDGCNHTVTVGSATVSTSAIPSRRSRQ
ncbi:hypothetical protein BV898_11005 [Hypsibius exemplaris]|uniref:Uncharacterized protein n=1 Tax=Hypsibius exemplaris TaxID=2072580 RepID=A0A1W0WI23_HYPEX|nr:hypothetical protein BV898_11005 [Hypsibius exemplaris]